MYLLLPFLRGCKTLSHFRITTVKISRKDSRMRKPGPGPRLEDRWGWFKWSVHVRVIDLEDSTTSHWGDDEGLGWEARSTTTAKTNELPDSSQDYHIIVLLPCIDLYPLHFNKALTRYAARLHVLNVLFLELKNSFDCSFGPYICQYKTVSYILTVIIDDSNYVFGACVIVFDCLIHRLIVFLWSFPAQQQHSIYRKPTLKLLLDHISVHLCPRSAL